MKKLLLICLLLGVFATTSVAQVENFAGTEIELDERERNDKEIGGGPRSITIAPPQASLYNNMVCLNFIETFSSVTVTITNLSTGELVYHEESSHPTVLTIELLATESASYMLEVQTGSTVWEGFFSN